MQQIDDVNHLAATAIDFIAKISITLNTSQLEEMKDYFLNESFKTREENDRKALCRFADIIQLYIDEEENATHC